MFRMTETGRPCATRPALVNALRIGTTLLFVASPFGPLGWARADDPRVRRMAQAEPGHDMSAHRLTDPSSTALPPALPQPRSTLAMPRVAAPATTPSSTLGLADFEQIALQRNPTLRQAAAQVEASQSRSYQAGLYPNPTLGYVQEQIGALGESRPTPGGVVARGKGSPGELVGGFVQQEIVTGGKLRLSRAKFAEEATAARFQADAQRLRVVNGVRTRYFEVVAAERLIAIHRELSDLNDDAVKTTEQLVNVGQANEPDLLQAKVEARRAKVAFRNAENRYRGSWENLVSLVGAPELRPTHLDDSAFEAPATPLEFDATLANLLRCSPEIQAALAEIRRSQVMVRRERAEPIPNVTLQAVVGRNYEFNITTAGVQASIPLPLWNRNQGTIREAQSDLVRDHAEHERVALSLRNRLADAATRYEDARQSIEDFRTESLPLARRAFEVQSANYRQRRAALPTGARRPANFGRTEQGLCGFAP